MLSRHIRQSHMDYDPTERLARTTVCYGCATDYRSRIRLISHLRGKRRVKGVRNQPRKCLRIMAQLVTPLTDDELRVIQQQAKEDARKLYLRGLHSYKADLPCINLPLPSLQDHCPTDESDSDSPRHQARLPPPAPYQLG